MKELFTCFKNTLNVPFAIKSITFEQSSFFDNFYFMKQTTVKNISKFTSPVTSEK